jgi:TolB-like protein/Tfp pilus assembly protein PilF
MDTVMIAISYRREDSLPISGRLYDRLQAKFGAKNVFIDLDSIRPGLDFREQISDTISRADAVIAVIGPRWLGELPDASLRITDPNDFVRLEIASALKCNIPVIPVLVDGTPMPKREKLPADIQELAFRQALPLSSGLDFHQHTERLISGICHSLNVAPPSKRRPEAKPGLRRPPERDRFTGEGQKKTARWWSTAFILTVLGLAAAAGGFYALSEWSHSRTSAVSAGSLSEAVPEKSIAVLPFENLSDDKTNAYFAEGIQDEILTRLAKIGDLKVVSHTSTQHYKSTPENLPTIARQLRVAYVLEGSVQKSGDAVRVNVQLIKALNDAHVWADSFDRKLTDIFSVETEVAKAIADQLRAKLTGAEQQAVAAKPTDNPEAHDAYLRGLAYSLKTQNTPANSLAEQRYLREAVGLDPKFALAWAQLSYRDSVGYLTQVLQPTVELREEARRAAETALNLQPKLGEAVLAKGEYHYACLKEYDTAVRYFEQARSLLPNNSKIPEALAYVARRRGEWDRSETYFNEAERLDPRNVRLLGEHAGYYIFLRRFPKALRKLDEVLNIAPDDMDTVGVKASIAQAEGDLPRAAVLLSQLQPAAEDTGLVETQIYQGILERRPAPVINRVIDMLAKPNPALGFYNGELRFWLGWAQEVAGDHAAAQRSWRQARSELEPFLQEQSRNVTIIGDLALINAGLGDKAAALALAQRAMSVISGQEDALSGPFPLEIFSRVAAQTGEPDQAIAALQKVLSLPYASTLAANAPLTPALLRLDPMFDPLRSDPRFEKLVSSVPMMTEQ